MLIGDGTYVMAVSDSEVRKEVKMRKRSSVNVKNQRWRLHFENDTSFQERPALATAWEMPAVHLIAFLISC